MTDKTREPESTADEAAKPETGEGAKKRRKKRATSLEKLVALSKEQGIIQAKQLWIAIWSLRIAIISTFLTLVAIIIAVWIGWDKISSVQTDVKQTQLVITSPSEGERVGLGQKVYGKTPFFKMNHYIVVRLVRTGTAYVQSEPAYVSPDGSFSGEARFGDQTVGLDDEFRIQVLATKTTFPAGVLTNAPDDAVLSKSVTVRRVGVPGDHIVITSLTNGAEVEFDDRILGTTPFPELNHYIVVTPVRVGTAFVQDNPASVNRVDGTFSGTARFGGAEVGVGEQFIVRVLATKTILPAGPLTHEPENAVTSNSVTVRRKR